MSNCWPHAIRFECWNMNSIFLLSQVNQQRNMTLWIWVIRVRLCTCACQRSNVREFRRMRERIHCTRLYVLAHCVRKIFGARRHPHLSDREWTRAQINVCIFIVVLHLQDGNSFVLGELTWIFFSWTITIRIENNAWIETVKEWQI